jgi:hypothetical protein
MNKLVQPIFTKTDWGSEIIWTITKYYIGKTIEISPYRITNIMVNKTKEKSIIVVDGQLSLAVGPCCDERDMIYYDLPTGWSWHIDPGKLHRYGATDVPLRLIEVASPQLDDTIIFDEDDQW